MRILIACEYSGRVRDAFLARGHDALSCDLQGTESPGPHCRGPVQDILNDGWDMLIGFPPCTYLCASGLHWNKRIPGRAEKTEQALEFFKLLFNSGIQKIALENPVGCISTRIRKPDQVIQPYQFGDDASKKTCLWLKGLPLLKPTGYYPPRIVGGKKRWGNQSDSGQNNMSSAWAKIRSLTYHGIAEAMAKQWG